MSARDLPLVEARLQTLQQDLTVAINAISAASDAFIKLSQTFGAMFDLLQSRSTAKSSNSTQISWCLKMLEKDLNFQLVRDRVSLISRDFSDTMRETDKMINDCRLVVVDARKNMSESVHTKAINQSAHALLSSFSVIFGQYEQYHKDNMHVYSEVAHQYKRVKAAILELLTGEVIGTPSASALGLSPPKSTASSSSSSRVFSPEPTLNVRMQTKESSAKKDSRVLSETRRAEVGRKGAMAPTVLVSEEKGEIKDDDCMMLDSDDPTNDGVLPSVDALATGTFFQARGDHFAAHQDFFSKGKVAQNVKVLVKEQELPRPLTLKGLFQNMMADGTTWFAEYHERRGDLHRACDNWSVPPEGTSQSGCCGWRKAQWETIVKAPMKRQVTVEEKSCYYFVLDEGAPCLFFHATSQTPKVPMGDTFRTEYIIRFRQESPSVAAVTFSAYMKVTFVKSCMLKGKIESTSSTEMAKGFEIFQEMLLQSCRDLAGQAADSILTRRASLSLNESTSNSKVSAKHVSREGKSERKFPRVEKKSRFPPVKSRDPPMSLQKKIGKKEDPTSSEEEEEEEDEEEDEEEKEDPTSPPPPPPRTEGPKGSANTTIKKVDVIPKESSAPDLRSNDTIHLSDTATMNIEDIEKSTEAVTFERTKRKKKGALKLVSEKVAATAVSVLETVHRTLQDTPDVIAQKLQELPLAVHGRPTQEEGATVQTPQAGTSPSSASQTTEKNLASKGIEFNCALQKGILRQGLLFVRPQSLLFQSLFLETPLEIDVSQIQSVTKKKTARIFDNAIGITVIGVPEEYFFTSFVSRNDAWNEIMKVWTSSSSGDSTLQLQSLLNGS